jgi:dihydrofolate synthase/folylpolyglutamate synthase
MSYAGLIQKLLNVNLFGGMKLGLQNMQRLQQLLHFPDQKFPSIHVAGTNGKGSVTTKIAHAFEHAGYRVGLYTSPHLSCFRERIRINGIMIPEEAVESILARLFHVVESEQIPATFFELTTMMAFLYFAQEEVDIAVLETGLGGRLDATNVVHPCLSIITSISLEHVDILGNTREVIAIEKGGIIKEKVAVIIGPHVPLEPIQAIALEKQSLCIQVQETSSLFEEENRQIARAALNYLATPFSLSTHAIERGLEGKQPCRFEIIPGPSPIILDVAHNPDGVRHLFQMLEHHYPNHSIRLLFGLSKNKDIKGCLNLFAMHGSSFHLVEAKNGRGASTKELEVYLRELSVDSSRFFLHESIFEAVDEAKKEALKNQEVLVICGTFFIMREARQALGFHEPFDEIDLNERHQNKQDAIKSHDVLPRTSLGQ